MKKGIDYIGIGVGAMIFNDQQELLMLKRGQACQNERGCWEIPGGSVKFGETLADATIREVKEELGIDVVILHQLLAADHLIPAEGQHWVAVPFVVQADPDQVPQIIEPEKCEELAWFQLDNLPTPQALTTDITLKVYQYHLQLVGDVQQPRGGVRQLFPDDAYSMAKTK